MSTVLTRQALYDRIWNEPIQKVSKDFGLSGVGLAKACRRHGIPVPPRGYWAKKQAGRRVKRLPLPPRPPGGRYGDRIEFTVRPRRAVVEQPPDPPELAAESGRTIDPPKEDLRITHRLLRSTADYWAATRGPWGQWPKSLPEHIQIGVTEGLRRRALRVLQALFSALEKRGYSISVDESAVIQVAILGEICPLKILEPQRQVRTQAARLVSRSTSQTMKCCRTRRSVVRSGIVSSRYRRLSRTDMRGE